MAGHTSYGDDYVDAMRVPTQPMETSEIVDIMAAFAGAARNAMEAGFDGVALHGGHGYLIDSFLWHETNLLNDRYGGDAARRATFAAEIVPLCGPRSAMPRSCSAFPNTSSRTMSHVSARPEELGALLVPLAQAGVDLFDASGRVFDRPAFEGSKLSLAGWARQLTGKPSVAIGGIGLAMVWAKP